MLWCMMDLQLIKVAYTIALSAAMSAVDFQNMVNIV